MPFPVEIRFQIRMQSNFTCAFCGRQDPDTEVHHKIPTRDGGSNAITNAEALCSACHDMFDHEQEKGLSYDEAYQRYAPYAHYLQSNKV